MLTLAGVKQKFPERSHWLNFDNFLELPESHLSEVLQHYGIQETATQLLCGAHMQQYAKRPDVPYDTNFRRRLLQQAQLRFSDEIERGLRWVEAIQLPENLHLPISLI